MKQRSFLLVGAVGFGFLVGACARFAPSNSGHNNLIETAAQAQTARQSPIRNAGDLQRLSTTYADIARQVTPAVVNISSQQIIRGRVLRDPFGELFGSGEEMREPDQKAQSTGSGVIVNANGIVITNNHVIANADSITVTLTDRRRFKARLLGTDPPTDVAVLKIDSDKPLPTVPFADSDKAAVGDIVLAIGSPFNLASSVTQGILSAKARRDLGISAVEDFLQTDAAINPGNSGGALVDISGKLVGINTAILSRSGGNQGIGLAIPSRLVQKISSQLQASGRVTRGYLGIVAEAVTDDIAAELGLQDGRGVLVTGVAGGSPAETLPWARRGGNVVLKANGQAVETPGQLRNLIADAAPGSPISLEVWQNGKTQTFSAKAGRRGPDTRGI